MQWRAKRTWLNPQKAYPQARETAVQQAARVQGENGLQQHRKGHIETTGRECHTVIQV